jgi:hypothetical protein
VRIVGARDPATIASTTQLYRALPGIGWSVLRTGHIHVFIPHYQIQKPYAFVHTGDGGQPQHNLQARLYQEVLCDP